MKIGILGGTGDLGRGLAQRLSINYEIIVGSRDKEKAKTLAAQYSLEIKKILGLDVRINGLENKDVLKSVETVIITLPYQTLSEFLISNMSNFRKEQLIISPIVPMEKTEEGFIYMPFNGGGENLSSAELIHKKLPQVERISSAFHTVPAIKLADLKCNLNYDVLVASDSKDAWEKTADLVRNIGGLKPYYAGRLYLSRYLEPLTPLMLNVAINNKLRTPSLRILAETK